MTASEAAVKLEIGSNVQWRLTQAGLGFRIEDLGFRIKGFRFRGIHSIMENQMEKRMEHDMKAGLM